VLNTALIIAAALAAAPAAPATNAPSPDGEDKKICKREAITGSRVPERRCLTRAQWEQIQLSAQRALQESRRQTRGDPGN
jgi:Spy/CpxP family protein refolding chaperone